MQHKGLQSIRQPLFTSTLYGAVGKVNNKIGCLRNNPLARVERPGTLEEPLFHF